MYKWAGKTGTKEVLAKFRDASVKIGQGACGGACRDMEECMIGRPVEETSGVMHDSDEVLLGQALPVAGGSSPNECLCRPFMQTTPWTASSFLRVF